MKPKQAENDNINAVFAENLRNRPTDGLIRKQDALDALMKERQHLLANNQPGAEHILTHHGYNVIDELPTVQPEILASGEGVLNVPDTNVGDMISRQDAIKAICEDGTWLERQGCTEITMAERKQRDVDIIENLPPIQPKRGKWLPDNRCGGGYWVCSLCKYPTEAFAADVIYKYCPFCGADMRGNEDGAD